MEVVHSAPETFTSSVRRKNLLPLNQLDTRKPANVPHHLLETRAFTKLKSNGVVQAEPSELHFSGFEVGKDYRKTLKLVNISCEVLSVHILPPLTKNFQITYTKKYRLVPGLAYTVTVNFHPDEWHYFFDNIRIHSEGEENILVPIHAYPVINDLHIPSHISLPPVPLGQSKSHMIPLKCSCPIDFKFHVHCLQPHEAFTVRPLSGIIPANGKTEIEVTFTPVRYCTADITLQLVISQFNSKPVVWTVTGSSSPYLLASTKDASGEDDNVLVEEKSYHRPKMALALSKGVEKKRKGDQMQESNSDVPTHAIQPQDKMRFKDFRDVMSNTKPEEQTKKMKEKKVKQKLGDDHNRWPSDVGNDKLNTPKLKYGGKTRPKRVLRNAKQVSGQLKVRSKVRRLFQQAVRKVIRQCRKNKRIQSDKKSAEKLLKLTPEKLLPFSFPTFLHEDQPDELAVNALGRVPVRPPSPDMKLSLPIFSLKNAQYNGLMGYQPRSVYDAAATFIPSNLCRPLRTGGEDEPALACSDLSEDEKESNTEEHEGSNEDLHPCDPEAILQPNDYSLRIFNPAPHVYAFKPVDFHRCPLPRYTQKSSKQMQDSIKEIMTWKKFPLMDLSTISSMSSLTGEQATCMSDPFSNTLLPAEVLHAVQILPKDNIQPASSDRSELSLTPKMVKAEFVLSERSSATSLKLDEDADDRTQITEASGTSSRVM